MTNYSEKINLDKLRHSCAHLLAAAVLDLLPDTKLGIGPPIEDGFYYDFEFKDSISEDALPEIEQEMHRIAKDWEKFERIEKTTKEAKKMMSNQPYKLELIEELADESGTISFYRSGDFIDLCKGGHIDKPTKKLKHFKLLSIAGAYWRGDEKNKMLTRIYATCFTTKKELNQYLKMREEAKKRDHKLLGPRYDLFFFSNLVGAGMALWTPKGTLLRNILDNFVWQLRKKRGYTKVEIPHLAKKELYVTSGHWDKFQEELFKIESREGHLFVLKPMNCPHHIEIFKYKPRSYREMPQRFANTTMVYRDEQTGELSGLTRVRCITQDDAHVFCRKNQMKAELLKIWDIVDEFYQAVGFNLDIRLSLHDPEQFEKYLGKQSDWVHAENQMRKLVKERRVKTYEATGEAAFYGPKIDFIAKDSLGREWQVATIQLDMNMPERFDIACVNEKGEKERVIMLHAAIMGAIERYIAILIEHFAGAFPVWLHPVQVRLLPVSDKFVKYASRVGEKIKVKIPSIRIELNDGDETLGNKIRKAQQEKIPYMLIIGAKEEKNNTVNLRLRTEKEIGEIKIAEFVQRARRIIDDRSLQI